MLGIREIMLFILATPGGFPGWPITYIFDEVNNSICSGGICVVVEGGEIIGVMLVRVDNRDRIFHIKQLLVKNKLALAQFISYFKLRFSGYKITGERGGKIKHYTERSFNLLLKVK